MFLGFFAWYAGLARGGVARIGQVQLAQPVLTLGWSAVLLGEHVGEATLLTALAVLAAWRRRSARDEDGYPFARMAVNTNAVGKSYPPLTYAVGREKIREYAFAVGETNPLHLEVAAARALGYRDVVAPPMFAAVYSSPAMGPALFDPEVGINFALMVHGGQEFKWGPLVDRRRRDRDHGDGQGHLRAQRDRLLRLRVRVHQPGRRHRVRRHLVEHRARRVSDAGRR